MDDISFMRRALEEARRAFSRGDVPVGAVVVSSAGEVLGTGANRKTDDPTAHAEVQAIRAAAVRGHWNLSGCGLYVTLEPCPMCAGACVNARVSRVVFGARDSRAGAGGSLYNILRDSRLNHRCEVREGVLAEEAERLLRGYFLERRGRPGRRGRGASE